MGSAQQVSPGSQPVADEKIPTSGIDPESLLNQSELEERLQALLSRARTESVRSTLALLQLKNFYEIRTWVGKAEASLLLADITLVLCRALPPTVTLSRCHNNEFALLLSNECSNNAPEITRRVQSALQSAVSSTIPPQLQLLCSVGLARVDAGVQSADVLFARARHNLSHADNDSEMSMLDSKELARMIPRALRKGQLELNYQPLLRFKQTQQRCFEVRSKLNIDDGEVPGQQLFAAAVWNALGEVLDRSVIHRCKTLLASAGNDETQLIINLSLNSLVSSKFTSWLSRYLDKYPEFHDRLLLQISELDLLVAQHHLTTFSIALRDLQIPLCITHFGSTRDPLRYLHLLQVHMVKLDASLVNKLRAESLHLESVRKLIDKLHTKGIRVAAGMIDRASLLPLLWQIGVDAVQGDSIANCASVPEFPAIEYRHISSSEVTN